MGDSSQAMGARQAESRTRPLVGKSKNNRTVTKCLGIDAGPVTMCERCPFDPRRSSGPDKLAHGNGSPFFIGDRPGGQLQGDAPGAAVAQPSHVVHALIPLVQYVPCGNAGLDVKLKAQQTGLRAGHRICAQNLLRQSLDPLGANSLDAKVKRACRTSGVHPRLNETHIFLKDCILDRDPQRQDAINTIRP